MARLARIVVPDCPHHVTARGNRREPIFFQDGDQDIYCDLLAEQMRKAAVEVWAGPSPAGRLGASPSPGRQGSRDSCRSRIWGIVLLSPYSPYSNSRIREFHRGRIMKIWIGFEATSDVTESNGTEYAAFESALNNELTTLENDYTIHLILIIMNAEIAPPFPEGYIFRKTKKSYDCKLHVPFDKWMMDDGILRWNLLADAARKAISSIKINQIDDEIRASAFAAVDLVRGQRMAGTGAPFPTP